MILLHDILGSFSALELAWTVSAITGLYLSRLNGVEALHDFQALGGRANGRRRIALGTIRDEIVRGFANVLFLVVGLYAGSQPANPNVSLMGLLVLVALFVGVLAFNVNSALGRRDRLYLMTYGMQSRDESGRFVKEAD